MPRMSKKRKHELSFYLNDRGRVTYNELCRKCQHGCKQSFRAVVVDCPRYLSKRAKKKEEHTDFTEEIIADADILYMTRVQRERFTDLMEYERVKNIYILRNKMLEHTRPNLRILHPLPRVNEIALDVDDNPKAYYFQQAQNGLYAREAILCDVLGITLEDVKKDGK